MKSTWYRITLSPHEWTWTQDEQEEMANHILKQEQEINELRRLAYCAKEYCFGIDDRDAKYLKLIEAIQALER